VSGLRPLEPLLRYVLRPPIAEERLEPRPGGLVRSTLKKAYTGGTVAVEMDPLSLLLPPGHQRACAVLAHRALCGRARGRQPVEQVLEDEQDCGSHGDGADELV
jgi:hypothetical protein